MKKRSSQGKTRKRRKKQLIEKYGLECFWCGTELINDGKQTPKSLSIDHLVQLNLWEGRLFDLHNLVLSCHSCNMKRSKEQYKRTQIIFNQN